MATIGPATAVTRAVQVLHLGRMGYLQAWDLQRRYARQHVQQVSSAWRLQGRMTRAEGGRDVLLLVEHAPVYVAGRQSSALVDEEEENRLKTLGAEFYRDNRQDHITFHGPGQLVAYPILNLRHFPSVTCMTSYVTSLHALLVNTCRRLGLDDARLSDRKPGVLVNGKQIGTVGVQSHGPVTTQGLSLNCNVDLSWFRNLQPCGGEGAEVTDLSRELRGLIPIRRVLGPFVEAFEQEFRCQVEFSMLDAEDASLLREEEEEEGEEGQGVVGSGREGSGRGKGVRAEAWSSSSQGKGSAGSARRRVSMW